MSHKKVFLIFMLTSLLISSPGNARPPFHGTIFIEPDIVTDRDPSAFIRLEKSGTGVRNMYDRRINGWENYDVHLFTAIFDDQRAEVQVNSEFEENTAFVLAKKYSTAIGQLPFALRKDMKTVWIHDGNQGFGGGNNNIMIHTKRGDEYIAQGILEEALIHEAAHTSLDEYYGSANDWRRAQKKDGDFISDYARDNPDREDIAESFLLYFALRYKPERIDKTLKNTIQNTMAHRIAYFDSLTLAMHPVR